MKGDLKAKTVSLEGVGPNRIRLGWDQANSYKKLILLSEHWGFDNYVGVLDPGHGIIEPTYLSNSA